MGPSVRVCVCLCLQPPGSQLPSVAMDGGQRGHGPQLQLQMRGPTWGGEGRVEVQAGPGASQRRRSAVLLRRRAVGLELARRSQRSPRAYLAGWTCSRRAGAQHWAPRRSPAVVSPLPSDACPSPLARTWRSRCPPPCSGPATLSEGLAPPAPQTLRLPSALLPGQLSAYVRLQYLCT